MLEKLSGGARVVFAFAGVMGAFTLHNYIIEDRLNDEFEKNGLDPTSCILFLQALFSVMMAASIQVASYNPQSPPVDGQPTAYWMKLGLLISASMLPSIKAVPYLSSPLCQLIKTFKGPAILIMYYFFGSDKLARYKYFTTMSMFAGIIMYSVSSNNYKNGITDAFMGFGLALLSLAVDPFVAYFHDKYEKVRPDQLSAMKQTNLWIAIFMMTYAVVSGELIGVLEVMKMHPHLLKNMLLISGSGALGQYFVTYTIAEFGPHFLSVLTSSRKFLSVVLSIIFFGHHVNYYQYLGILLVICTTIVETKLGAKQKSKEINEKRAAAKKND